MYSKFKSLTPLLYSLGFVTVASLIFDVLTPWLDVPILAMGYLLLVLFASMRLSYWGALLTAVFSFIALNFFFIEPRYTLQVARLQSLLELLGFLAVSITMVSIMERLKTQSLTAKQAQMQAEAARQLAEKLLRLRCEDEILDQGAQAIASAFLARVILVSVRAKIPASVVYDTDAAGNDVVDAGAARWVAEHHLAIGPTTGYWPQLYYWCIPLQISSTSQMVLFLYASQTDSYTKSNLAFLQGLTGQVSLALGLLYAKQSEQVAMQQAERENIHNALLASLSHDFRTPLTTIVGAASSLRHQQSGLSMMQQESLCGLIESEAIAMLDDAENILSLTRVETLGRLALHADWQSLEELIGVVLSRCRQRYSHRKFDLNCDRSLPLIFVDAKLIIQAVMNLVENAIKFDTSGAVVKIAVKIRDDDYVMVSVQDRGVGISQDITQLMTKFVRGQPESRQPGFGLGLTICDAIAKVHGGQLRLENDFEGGLNASILLPIRHDQEPVS